MITFCRDCGFDMDDEQIQLPFVCYNEESYGLAMEEAQESGRCNVCFQAEYEAAMEAQAEDRYNEQIAQAEMDAENAYERYLENQGEDDPYERELWALDPQIGGYY